MLQKKEGTTKKKFKKYIPMLEENNQGTACN